MGTAHIGGLPVGTSAFVVENWATLPDNWEFGDVAAVVVDSKDRVYVFTAASIAEKSG